MLTVARSNHDLPVSRLLFAPTPFVVFPVMRVPRDFRETRRRLTAALVEVRVSLQSRRPDAERVSERNAVEPREECVEETIVDSDAERTQSGVTISGLRICTLSDDTADTADTVDTVDTASSPTERNSPPWEVVKRRKIVPDWHTGDEVVPDPEGFEPAASQYKYADPVRKQADRALLPAGYCAECARFYILLGRPSADCHHAETSRHRRRWQAPESPPDFWHIRPPEPHSP